MIKRAAQPRIAGGGERTALAPIAILGAGAFGSALAITLAEAGRDVWLWARSADHAAHMNAQRCNPRYLPGARFPACVHITDDLSAALEHACMALLSVPMQNLRGLLSAHRAALGDVPLIACCKGVDVQTLLGPSAVILSQCPNASVGVLTGPSFAADLGRGLPTALTLAAPDSIALELQEQLSTQSLRVYRTDDIIGAELGGALKNVIAIAAGIVIGAGLGESARAALITRGYAEMLRFAKMRGARSETLAGLSGLGDLILTCNSPQSRNFSYGHALGAGKTFDPSITVEGAATADALCNLAEKNNIDIPVTAMVARLVKAQCSISEAIETLLNRPLKKE